MTCSHPNIPTFTQDQKQELWDYRKLREEELIKEGFPRGRFGGITAFDFSNTSEKCSDCGELFCWTSKEEIDRTVNNLRRSKQ